ncbi:MAG: hypothetical protein U0800_07125 [Isosphaeraceae bacterium]
MTPKWRLRPFEPERVRALSSEARLHPLIAQLLLNRGIDRADRAIDFLESRQRSLHDPEKLPGAVEAADRLVAAIRADRPIVVYGDYDVDGVCGTSSPWARLKAGSAWPRITSCTGSMKATASIPEALRIIAVDFIWAPCW